MTQSNTLIQPTAAVDGTGWTCVFERLAWDSEHFGVEIGRLNPLAAPQCLVVDEGSALNGAKLIDQVCGEAERAGTRLICASADSEDSLTQRALNKTGFVLMDTLVTHELRLAALRGQLLADGNVRLAAPADLPALERIAVDCFAGRKYNVSRLNSEPLFDQGKVADLFGKWMQNSLNGQLADRVYVFAEGDQVLGFVTLKLPREGVASIPLNAVDPSAHGKGIYTKMVHHVVRQMQKIDAQSIQIKTQLPNFSVHRAWSRIGGSIVATEHRFHRTA